MFIVHVKTAAGLLAIGLTDITLEQTNETIGALVEMLDQVSGPITVTSTDVYVVRAPDDSPVTIAFRYLGSSTSEFADQEAYAAWMNESLALNIYQCATSSRIEDGGRTAVDYESFEMIEAEALGSMPAVN